MQTGGRFWRSNRRGCAPTGNIDVWGFEDIDPAFVQLVNNVPFPCSTLSLRGATCASSFTLSSFSRSAIFLASSARALDKAIWDSNFRACVSASFVAFKALAAASSALAARSCALATSVFRIAMIRVLIFESFHVATSPAADPRRTIKADVFSILDFHGELTQLVQFVTNSVIAARTAKTRDMKDTQSQKAPAASSCEISATVVNEAIRSSTLAPLDLLGHERRKNSVFTFCS